MKLAADTKYSEYDGFLQLLYNSFYQNEPKHKAPDKAFFQPKSTGPSCSKLTMSLVNDSLKFPSSDTQIC